MPHQWYKNSEPVYGFGLSNKVQCALQEKKAISIISNPSSLQAEGDAGSISGDETWKFTSMVRTIAPQNVSIMTLNCLYANDKKSYFCVKIK